MIVVRIKPVYNRDGSNSLYRLCGIEFSKETGALFSTIGSLCKAIRGVVASSVTVADAAPNTIRL